MANANEIVEMVMESVTTVNGENVEIDMVTLKEVIAGLQAKKKELADVEKAAAKKEREEAKAIAKAEGSKLLDSFKVGDRITYLRKSDKTWVVGTVKESKPGAVTVHVVLDAEFCSEKADRYLRAEQLPSVKKVESVAA